MKFVSYLTKLARSELPDLRSTQEWDIMPEMKSDAVILFWNVWMETQFTAASRKKLFSYLDVVLGKYNPDFIGINEVIFDKKVGASYLLDFFESKGYHCTFTPFSPVNERFVIGSGFMSRYKPASIEEHVLGTDKPASKRGYDDYTVKTMEITVAIGSRDEAPLRIVVTYLAHLVPYNWLTHQKHYRKLQALLDNERFQQRTIVVGDFNEPKYHPNMIKLTKKFHRRTGSFLNPTWRLHGKKRYTVRANYDNILWSKDDSLQPKNFEVLQNHPSDHAPLLAMFRVG